MKAKRPANMRATHAQRVNFARLKDAPPGLLAVVGSLVLLALGTFFALAKHRWAGSEASPLPEQGELPAPSDPVRAP